MFMKLNGFLLASILLATILSSTVFAQELVARDPVALTVWEKVVVLLEKMNDNLISIFSVLEETANKECEWETVNQGNWALPSIGFDNQNSPEYRDWEQRIQVPEGILYEEINVVSGRIRGDCRNGNLDCEVVINGVSCLNIPSETSDTLVFELPDACLNEFVAGDNSIIMRTPPFERGFIRGMFLETQIKPANC